MVAFTAIGVSIVSFLLSVTALLVHYAKRGEHPLVAPLEAQIDALRLSQTDVIDRVDQFMRRDRTRRLRQEQSDEAHAPEIPVKQQLRARARELGILK